MFQFLNKICSFHKSLLEKTLISEKEGFLLRFKNSFVSEFKKFALKKLPVRALIEQLLGMCKFSTPKG